MTKQQARYLYNLFMDPDYMVRFVVGGIARYEPRMTMGESKLPLVVWNGADKPVDLLTAYPLESFEVFRNVTKEVLAGAPKSA